MSNPFLVPFEAESWAEVPPDSDFPIQNLPFGIACFDGDCETTVVRIGDHVVDLCVLGEHGLLDERDHALSTCMLELSKEQMSRVRQSVFELLHIDNPTLRDQENLRKHALVPISEVEIMLPIDIPAFVDFYSGIHHASNVGKMFRPEMEPLLPNYRHLPVGYNGRASSVVPSGSPIHRPNGQMKLPNEEMPIFGPTQELDFELELGFFVGEGNDMGKSIAIEDAEDHILGLVLVNDWSARDFQRWEYQPLGPFLAKSFATSISPWIVSLDALEPFRCAGPEQVPPPLPHLSAPCLGHYDLRLEVAIKTPAMTRPQVITQTNARELYWSFIQQLAHQTSNGTPTEIGDLYASGTISGSEAGSFGSLLETTWRGSKPILLEETGEQRTFLEDGDTVIMRGYGISRGIRIGFGELVGTVDSSLGTN